MRLGKTTFPDVPELVGGYCPQCGGSRALQTFHAHGETFTGSAAAPEQQAA